jgi:putative zinc finger/helix-turn-helix YgiT family protein
MNGLRCQECGFETVDSDQSVELTRLVSDAYRRAHGLLTGREICEKRGQLGMSQEVFAEYLGTGVASVKRWETGKIQDRAMDELIRLKTDARAARKNLQSLEQVALASQSTAQRRKTERRMHPPAWTSHRRLRRGTSRHSINPEYVSALPFAVSSVEAGYNSTLGSRTAAATGGSASF